MKKLFFILSVLLSLGLTGCSNNSTISGDKQPNDGKALVNVKVNWDKVSEPPEKMFPNHKMSTTSEVTVNSTLPVTDFGVRIEYLTDNAVYTQSVTNTNNDSTSLITLDIPTADSVSVFAVAVNDSTVVNMGVIKSQVLNNAVNYNFTVNDFKWVAPSWGAGKSFAPNGWDVAHAHKDSVKSKVTFNVIDPFDGPTKNPKGEYDNFIIKINGSGGIGEYKGNDIREHYIMANNSNIGVADTTLITWSPYLDGSMFNLPNGRYIVDKSGTFKVSWE